MCGIIGCAGRGEDTLDTLVHGLSKLEYRGYDSAGVALADERRRPQVRRRIEDLREHLSGMTVAGTVGMGHTRWSTHGPPTDERPPHQDCTGNVAVVHNGIIENYQSLRDGSSSPPHVPLRHGHGSRPHLVEDALSDGLDPEAAFRQAVGQLEGSYAVALTVAGTESVFVARNDSPLVLGLGEDSTFFASDVPAFRDFTDQVVYLDDGEYARISPDGWEVSDVDGTVVEKEVDTVSWDP